MFCRAYELKNGMQTIVGYQKKIHHSGRKAAGRKSNSCQNFCKKENMGKIDVKNMDLYYGSFHALKNINLDIPEKKITAFIGPKWLRKIHFAEILKQNE